MSGVKFESTAICLLIGMQAASCRCGGGAEAYPSARKDGPRADDRSPVKAAPSRDQEVAAAVQNAKERLAAYGGLLTDYHRLTKNQGRTVAGTLMRCADSSKCETAGLCAGYFDEGCEPPSRETCASAAPCRVEGLCQFKGGRCLVGSDLDCRNSLVCGHGQCSAQEGQCSAKKDSDCEASELCAQFGACAAQKGLCLPSSDAHCAESRECEFFGRCSLRGHRCVAAGTDCSEACRLHGACDVVDESCRPTKEVHCLESAACRDEGQCELFEAKCVTPEMAEVFRLGPLPDFDEEDGLVDLSRLAKDHE